jgi:nicotinate-nucleotide adenylyltransferase
MEDSVSQQRPVRLALYGGAFDPVHCAHLRVARYALEQAHLDRVIFIPAAQSPLKAHSPFASDSDRLQMLSLALGGESHFALDAYEIEKGGVSYTIDTVRHFLSAAEEADLFWIIGADQFEQLERWRQITELSDLLTFLVLARPGADLIAPTAIPNLRYQRVVAPLMEESSSAVRERCRLGESLEGLVPSAVEAFISKQELYTSVH